MKRTISIARPYRDEGIDTYCFVIRSCLEQDFHLQAEAIDAVMKQSRKQLLAMYADSLSATAALLTLVREFDMDECRV